MERKYLVENTALLLNANVENSIVFFRKEWGYWRELSYARTVTVL
jgi:hypothetical protein